MTRTLRVTPHAQTEVLQTAEWYDVRRPHWGQLFIEGYLHTIEQIRRHPDSYQRVGHVCRRAAMHKFPFIVVYRLRPDSIDIIGVMPTRANPEKLGTRIESASQ